MKIRTALTLRYTCITAAVFLVFITAIYYVSEHSRSNAFFRNLKREKIGGSGKDQRRNADGEPAAAENLKCRLVFLVFEIFIECCDGLDVPKGLSFFTLRGQHGLATSFQSYGRQIQ